MRHFLSRFFDKNIRTPLTGPSYNRGFIGELTYASGFLAVGATRGKLVKVIGVVASYQPNESEDRERERAGTLYLSVLNFLVLLNHGTGP